MGLFGDFKDKFVGRGGDPETDTLWTTPWAWRDDDGCYVGWNGQVWLYRSFPLNPIAQQWEDPKTLLRLGADLDQLLSELGETSKEGLPGLSSSTADYREIHVVAVTWETEARPPEDTEPRLARYMQESFGFLVPSKALMLGVRLRPQGESGKTTVLEGLKQGLTSGLGESTPDLGRYQMDRNAVSAILSRGGCKAPTGEQLRQLESWYNMGKGPDAFIVERRDHLDIDQGDTIELAAVLDFNRSVHYAPHYQWAHEAETHPEGVRLISVRAELEPATAARRRTRQSQRRIRSQIEEEMATGDIERAEYSDTYELAQAVEQHFLNSQEPLLTRASIIMARRATEVPESYADYLHNYFDIDVRTLDMRQLPALDETLPCSSKRVNPFVQELSVGMVAYAGLHGFSALGDRKGVYVGLAHPNYTLTMLDPLGAPAANKPPSMGIFGDPGSGKAQPLDAPVLTPSGWTTMGQLRVGDRVVGSDGRPTEVLGVYPQGDRPIVRMVFNDGSSVECDTEHYWVTTGDGPGRTRGRRWRWQTAAEIAEQLDAQPGAKVRIPVVAPVQHERRGDLPLDPYLLGALVGDGGFRANSPTFTTADAEMVERVAGLLPEGLEAVRHDATTWRLVRPRSNRVAKLLAELGWGPGTVPALRSVAAATSDGGPDVVAGILAGVRDNAARTSGGALTLASDAVVDEVETLARSCALATGRHRSRGGRAWLSGLDTPMPGEDAPTEGFRHGYLVGLLWVRATVRDRGAVLAPREGCNTGLLPSWAALSPSGTSVADHGQLGVNPLTAALAGLGLWGKTSLDKHIPVRYLTAPVADRVALLQGLMDTDGGLEQVRPGRPTGSLSYSTSSERLARDVVALVQSLGGTASVGVRPTSYTGTDGLRHEGSPSWRLTIRLHESVAPFRLGRKAAGFVHSSHNRPDRWVVAVEHVGAKPAQCIMVAAEDHIYVTKDYLCTRNTFLAQMIAYQSSLMGLPVIFINPKGYDTLAPLAELAGGQVVSMSKVEAEGGAFDPFRYAPTPEMAAEILASHILSVMTGFTESQELALSYGLQQAAQRGARCAAEALRGVQDREIVELVVQQVRSSPTFALGFGLTAQERFDVGRRLTLIEFDRKLDLPDPTKDAKAHTRNERIALAAIRLVTRASLEILAQARGGVMIVDEAWTFLSHPSGLAALQQLGREGRSLNVFPVFCTQRIADLVGSDMEGYMSRVFVMSLREEREARAALKLCGVEATASRLQWLAQAGPQPGDDGSPARSAMGLHRDLQDRHAAVLVGPVPEHVRQALTTNPAERERIRKRLEAQSPGL